MGYLLYDCNFQSVDLLIDLNFTSLLEYWIFHALVHFSMTWDSPKCLQYKQLDIMDTTCCDIKFNGGTSMFMYLDKEYLINLSLRFQIYVILLL